MLGSELVLGRKLANNGGTAGRRGDLSKEGSICVLPLRLAGGGDRAEVLTRMFGLLSVGGERSWT